MISSKSLWKEYLRFLAHNISSLQDYIKDNSLQGLNAMTEGQDTEVKADMKVFYSS